mgnify:CR=1 FL=1
MNVLQLILSIEIFCTLSLLPKVELLRLQNVIMTSQFESWLPKAKIEKISMNRL